MSQATLQDRATAEADRAASGLEVFHRSNDSAAVTAILARVSSDQGGASASVYDQLVAARKAAAQLGWPVAAEYDDADISASRFSGGKERPGWQALLSAIASGHVTRVLVWAPNRASREMAEWSAFLNTCRRHRVLICVISHGNRCTTQPTHAIGGR
jgi:DNA invertase Pin-like site-specific DNA recombinase